MKPSKFLQIVLCLAGGIAVLIGASILRSPATFYALNHIDLGGNTNLLSEVRAPAGFLFTSGLLIATGAFVAQLTFTSTLLATLLYLSYGLSRLVGMVIDGIPGNSLVRADGIEIGLGLLCLLCLCIAQPHRYSRSN
ncbi:MAG: DUF4345 domain-containing protein [Cyanobacteria bacterium P01_D01_bin.56]